jgi:hypothetical protein
MSTDQTDPAKCSDPVDGRGDAVLPPAVLDEYCRAIHDLSNSLAAANMRLELYQFAASQGGALPENAVADVTRAMSDMMVTCQAVAVRLKAAARGSSRG